MAANRIAVVGAGIAGRGIACASIVGGFETIIEDIRSNVLAQATDGIRRLLDAGVAEGAISAVDAARALQRLRTAGRVEEVGDTDLIIEAGPEEMELKTELFGMLDKFARAGTILASSSPSLPITEMAEVTQRPERCIGMRFADAAGETGLLVLVRTPATSRETLEICSEVGRRMRRRIVTIDESPAGKSNREEKTVESRRAASQFRQESGR